MNSNDILTGLRVPSQVPLDSKAYSALLSSISTLGTNNQLAYSYFDGLIIFCNENKKKYIWEPVTLHIGETGLLASNFTYPTNYIVEGVTYSNKVFNLFEIKGPDGSETKVTAGSNVTVSGTGTTASPYVINSSGGTTPDATSTVKGTLKLTNDLGGTADLPTTPTAIHKTGDESGLTGIKEWTNTGTTQINGIRLINSGTGLSKSLHILNNSSGLGELISNISSGIGLYSLNNNSGNGIQGDNTGSGKGVFITNAGTGNGVYIDNQSPGSGAAFVINSGVGATGLLMIGKDNTINTFTLDKLGNLTANSFIKTGGTALQRLLADGTVEELNAQKVITANYTIVNADNNQTIFINNGVNPVIITVPSGLSNNFCVGFIQEGTGDITFIEDDTTIINPIGFKSKGQGYQTFLEKKLATETYYLLGNTKI
jgi:hypothetical protein